MRDGVSDRDAMFRVGDAHEYDAALHSWMARQPAPLRALANHWFAVMRQCGADVRECWHDGQATACIGDAPFAYVGIYTAHVSLGFYRGAALPDPHHLLLGTGIRMRHVKLRPGRPVDADAIEALIAAAYTDLHNALAAS